VHGLQRYLVEEIAEEYQHGRISRRELLRRVSLMTGGAAIGSSLLAGLQPAPALTAPAARPGPQAGITVSPTDPDIDAGMVQWSGNGAMLGGYLAQPRGGEAHPGVLLVHENQGLQEHNSDVCRRLAKNGYVALVVDLLSRQGGTSAFTDPAEMGRVLFQAPPDQLVGDLSAGLAYLRGLPTVRAGSTGVVGFCFGGSLTWLLATADPNLRAAVPFYGSNPPLDAVSNIQAAVLGIYGGEDARVDAGIPDIERAMSMAGKTFEYMIYPGAGHAFFNDTGANYNADAAADAWRRTLDWFGRHLAG
jgi:carboxymethylenebutenolidase